QANGRGGGIQAATTNSTSFATGVVTINGCNISNNTSGDTGGGLVVVQRNLSDAYQGTISNTTIAGNTANSDGGGILSNIGLILVNTTIDGNTAHGHVGGTYSYECA